jgi:hypothetical protein
MDSEPRRGGNPGAEQPEESFGPTRCIESGPVLEAFREAEGPNLKILLAAVRERVRLF